MFVSCPRLALLLGLLGVALVSLAATGHAQPAATTPAVSTGRVQVLLFGPDNRALPGCVVEAAGAAVTTNEQGAAALELPEGAHTLHVRIPKAAVPEAPSAGNEWRVAMEGVSVVAGELTDVIATFSAGGALLSLDIQAPEAGGGARSLQRAFEEASTSKPHGKVHGTVVASEGAAKVEGAHVYVRGAPVEAQTDATGSFVLDLPEGTYHLSIIHPRYSTQAVPNVEVRGGETASVNVTLSPASVELEELVVTAPHITGSIASLLDTRKESAATSDAIGAEDISRTPAGDAAGAAQRVVGVTVADGRFVYVRGLGERYTNALLNNSPMPSPEPDRAAVPLDLLPTQIVSSIDIAKTFTPDMPADFAGGSVRIETTGVPERFLLSGSVSTGWNSQATFKQRPSYQGGSRDWLGIDDGTRALSSEVPRTHTLAVGQQRPDGTTVTQNDLRAAGPSLNTTMAVPREKTPPNMGGNFAIGNGWKFRGARKFGLVGALSYSNKYTLRDEERRVLQPDRGTGADAVVARTEGNQESGNAAVRWAAFGSAAYEFSKHHQIRLMGFQSQLSDDQSQIFNGYSQNQDTDFTSTRVQFASRTLTFGQLRGQHEMPKLHDAQLDWRFAVSRAERSQPDTRDVVYTQKADTGEWFYLNNTESGRHFFADQHENAYNGAFDWTQPFRLWRLDHKGKTGAFFQLKDREFSARRFAFTPGPPRPPDSELSCGTELDLVACPNRLFTDEYVSAERGLTVKEGTVATDAYRAELEVFAGYLMGDIALMRKLRLIAGVRLESTRQTIATLAQLGVSVETAPDPVEVKALDVLPSAGLVYSFTDQMQLRASGTRTIARPQLRELAPFAFADYFGGYVVTGNPNLDLTRIINGDLRFEYFPSAREVLAVSAFVKSFSKPIESVFLPAAASTPVLTYQNAKGALLYGFELEARQGLHVIASWLEPLSIIGNFTLAWSEIQVRQTGMDQSGMVQTLTNTDRAMVNQAPYVVNLMLDYEGERGTQLRLLYNVSGPQLVFVGTEGLDDAFLHPRHSLDFTATQKLWGGLKLRLTLQNLVNPEYLITQGKEYRAERVLVRYTEGISASLSLGYTY